MSIMTQDHCFRAALTTRSQAMDLYPTTKDAWTRHFGFYLKRHVSDELFRALAQTGCQRFTKAGVACPGAEGDERAVCLSCAAVRIVSTLDQMEADILERLRAAGFDPSFAPFTADAMPKPPPQAEIPAELSDQGPDGPQTGTEGDF